MDLHIYTVTLKQGTDRFTTTAFAYDTEHAKEVAELRYDNARAIKAKLAAKAWTITR